MVKRNSPSGVQLLVVTQASGSRMYDYGGPELILVGDVILHERPLGLSQAYLKYSVEYFTLPCRAYLTSPLLCTHTRLRIGR